MATTKQTPRPLRTLIVLAILIFVAFGALLAGTKWSDASLMPNLALDLEGGTQIILTPVTTDGSKVTDTDIAEAITIIRQRVDSSGVSEAEITSQGGSNIVVGLPGTPSQETLELVRRSAQMNFRPVLEYQSSFGGPGGVTENPLGGLTEEDLADMSEEELAELLGSLGEAEEGAAVEEDNTVEDDAVEDPAVEEDAVDEDADDESTNSESLTGAASISTVANVIATDGDSDDAGDAAGDEAELDEDSEEADPAPAAVADPNNPSDLAQITPELREEFDALNCLDESALTGGRAGDPKKPMVTCSDDGTAKYILGPIEIAGTEISRANSGLSSQGGVASNTWAVSIEFSKEGSKKFADTTRRLAEQFSQLNVGMPVAPNLFAMTLDGLVISAPSVEGVIPNGQAEITGSFTRESSENLANQLNFGALPLTFDVQSEQEISATLGSEQLQKGLIAGAIGLLLVVIYSVFQYRVLGLVTVASLTIAAVVTYVAIGILSWTQGYRLSLPGVAGVIVAVGITADSFIVYFERIRDELRDGRSLSVAIDKAWDRAKRTILASDTVNFLAAIVLYFLAVGGVRGFAFTLGLTTIVDLVVVFFFTHPLLKLITKGKFFVNGHPWSGLDPRRLGVRSARYVGRGQVATAATTGSTTATPDGVVAVADDEDALVPALTAPAPSYDAYGRKMTIAERKAAAVAAMEADVSADESTTEGPSAAGDDEETV